MVYVSSEMSLIDTILDICHETNHLFLFNYDLNEAIFLIEGLAEFSMYYAGYLSNYTFLQDGEKINTTLSAYYFSIYHSVSMFFFDDNYYAYASYGMSYMFLLYLQEKYGTQVIKGLIPSDELDGPEEVEQVLLDNGYNISFNQIFLNFITACTIDRLDIYDDLFGFSKAEFQISNTRVVSNLPKTYTSIKHRYYGVEVEEITNTPNKFTLDIKTPDYPRSIGLVIVIHDDNGWNITQSILTGDGETVRVYCNGYNIENAYIISSLIKEPTPNAVRYWMASPFNELDISIREGHIYPTTTETRIEFVSLIPLLVIVILAMEIKKIKIK